MQTFAGFTPDLFDFLAELAMNNTREWFEGQKNRYEASVRGPAQALIRAMAPRLTPLSPHIVADDRKVGGSLMRIHRDTRFGSDKTPYKTNVGIQFRHSAGKDVHAPGLYLHIAHPGPGEMDGLFLGAGIYHPEKEPLEQIRQAIAEKPDAWRAVRENAAFAGTWTLGGESLKRPPRGLRPGAPLHHRHQAQGLHRRGRSVHGRCIACRSARCVGDSVHGGAPPDGLSVYGHR
jgi:uncharacterized protein (TIGR02453 family)